LRQAVVQIVFAGNAARCKQLRQQRVEASLL
jgi:hypothetical protein